MDNLDFNYFCAACKRERSYRKEHCFTSYHIKRYNRGEYLAFTGDPVRALSLLVKGSITVSFVLASGTVIRSVPHSAPYPMGALALLGEGDENRYRVDIVANEPCEVIVVGRAEIERQIMCCREFMLAFFNYSTTKLDLFVEQLTLLTQRSIAAKLAYYLFRCSADGKTYHFTKSVRELSEYLCVERPSLSRVIAKFVKEGLITYREGRGELVDVEGLKRIIE